MTTPCEPMLLKAAGKHSLWGGDKLIKEYGKNYLEAPLAETWECSTHENGLSYVDSGIWKGRTLKSVLKEHPEFLGSKYASTGELPILIKFIDANKDLSIQVHPNDTFASRYEHGALGRTEMWYVVEAVPGSHLIYGFYDDVNESLVREKISSKQVIKLLNKIPVTKGDVFYIKPGTVHALCGGCLVVEVQQNSDLTYRLYDYDRVDEKGRKRSLQIDKALSVCNFTKQNCRQRKLRIFKFWQGFEEVLLCSCPFFIVTKYVINTKNNIIRSNGNSGTILVCVNGSCMLGGIEGDSKILRKGNTVFVPAIVPTICISGRAEILKINY